jgi:hypothetical protein
MNKFDIGDVVQHNKLKIKGTVKKPSEQNPGSYIVEVGTARKIWQSSNMTMVKQKKVPDKPLPSEKVEIHKRIATLEKVAKYATGDDKAYISKRIATLEKVVKYT